MQPTHDGRATDPVLDCRAVSKSFRVGWRRRRVEALRGVDLRVERGEILGVLGPNGSGKTTLFKTLLGLHRPDSGSVRVLGAPAGSTTVKPRIGFVPEDNDYHGFLTIESTLALHGGLLGLPRTLVRERARRLVDLLNLTGHRGAVRTLSRGTVRKMAMAVALIGDPELLVLDEPTSGIDPLLSRLVRSTSALDRSTPHTGMPRATNSSISIVVADCSSESSVSVPLGSTSQRSPPCARAGLDVLRHSTIARATGRMSATIEVLTKERNKFLVVGRSASR